MSTTRQVAAIVIRRNGASATDVLLELPALSLLQVQRALRNAASLDLIESDGKKHRAGVHGSVLTTYYPKRERTARPAASVWHYAQQQA
jgi:hypothetical protein